jgi:hypothetical protein
MPRGVHSARAQAAHNAGRCGAHQCASTAAASRDSPVAEAVKVLARTRVQEVDLGEAAIALRLRAQLLEYFPAALTSGAIFRMNDTALGPGCLWPNTRDFRYL